MTTLLLTGATGLIGKALQRIVAERYPEITVTCGSRDYFRLQSAWEKLPKFDYIIHAAGYASPAKFLEHARETAFLNTTALMILLGKLNKGGRLVFLSTSEVYSGQHSKGHVESDIGTSLPSDPRGIYIESKRCGEAICHTARREKITAISARVCLAYGPGVKRGDKRVMSELIDNAIQYGSITLKDGGSAFRSYCYVDDVAKMLMNILMKGQQSLYNVGGNSHTTICGLAQRIGRMTNATVRIPRNMAPALDGSPSRVVLSMNRYAHEFGEHLYVDWEEGLAKTVAYHRELLGERVTVAA